jgi:hypothetical protein
MSQADDAWSRFRDEVEALARNLREQADLDQLRQASEAVMDSVNRVVQDPEVRAGTRRAVSSLGDAMAATFDQVAGALRSRKQP